MSIFQTQSPNNSEGYEDYEIEMVSKSLLKSQMHVSNNANELYGIENIVIYMCMMTNDFYLCTLNFYIVIAIYTNTTWRGH